MVRPVAVLIAITLPALSASGDGWQKLFDGRSLAGFDTFLRSKGLNNDPVQVFQVENGMIHISGSEFGYLITRQEYGNYVLRVEFKWGEKTWPPREGKARDSGVLFHVEGPDKVWPRSIEFQMIEGGTGDIILVDGASLQVAGETKKNVRIDRQGKGPWQDMAGFRDPQGEVENAHGEWNVLELTCDHGSIRYTVNGKLVNQGAQASPARGKILFQSEGAEVYFRSIELKELRTP